ncbi:MAG: DUF2141 domain-containing protein [Alphaproteobacteria bacterium]|nr:DUF2141 domain-containing protein [Alphaproteobacteria bacterium]
MVRTLATAVSIALFWVSQAVAADLSVEVEGLAGNAGQVLVALHNNSETFPSGWSEAVAVERVPASGPVVVRFRNVPPGRYAVMAVHDADGNGRMTKTWIGLPLEGFGASNNPGALGPPRFRQAAFDVTGDRTLVIRLVYL